MNRWTDSLVEKELRAATDALGHFPSAPELREMNLGPLESAIGRRGGIVAWAKRLGLERKHSDSDTGWDGEIAVQTLLERHGFTAHRTKRVKAPYDLLVNNRVRCDVKAAKQATYNLASGKPWSAWFYRIGKSVQGDVVILYRSDLDDCYVLPWFEVGTTNITISPNSPKYSRYHNRFDILTSFQQASQSIII